MRTDRLVNVAHSPLDLQPEVKLGCVLEARPHGRLTLLMQGRACLMTDSVCRVCLMDVLSKGVELETNGFQFYAIANFSRTVVVIKLRRTSAL